MFERFTAGAREAVVLAQRNARELDADEISAELLLLGALQSAGADLSAVLAGHGVTAEGVRNRLAARGRGEDSLEGDAEALRTLGIDLHAVRENVEKTFGPDSFDSALRPSSKRTSRRGHIPFTKSSKKALELSLREALAHDHDWIGCEHILLGMLRGGDEAAVALLTAEVDAEELRRKVEEVLDAAA